MTILTFTKRSETLSRVASLNSFTMSPKPKVSKPSLALGKACDGDSTGDSIIVDHTLVLEIPDLSPGEIEPFLL